MALFVVVRGSFEIARMFFSSNYPRFVKRFFMIMTTVSFVVVTLDSLRYMADFALVFSFVWIVNFGILFHRFFADVDQVLTFVAKSCLGLVYVCFLPATVVWMVNTEKGLTWFLCLLAVVFAGDIGAYLFGVTMGKDKIAPALSPNKSIQGSIGGLIFSIAAGLGFSSFLPDVPVWALLFSGAVGGILGQTGDFFESLIKRVSGVKDSGSIMPGHGGILDRLDGVLFAAPLFYFMALTFS